MVEKIAYAATDVKTSDLKLSVGLKIHIVNLKLKLDDVCRCISCITCG